jgi:hypothetical protein
MGGMGGGGMGGMGGGGMGGTSGIGGEIVVVPVKEIVQENGQYCWAAAAEMLTLFFANNDIPQCAQDSAAVKYGSGGGPTKPPPLANLTACCTGGAGGCQQAQYPQFPLWSENVRVSNGCLPPWSELRDQVRGKNAKRGPFAFIIDWGDNNGAHMRIVRGFAEDNNGTHLVLTYDPAGVGSLKWDDYGYYLDTTYFTITEVYDQIEHVSPGLPQGDPSSQLGKQTPGTPCGTPVTGVKPPSAPSAKDAAEAGRKVMLWLGKEDPKALGFKSLEEAANTAVDFSLQDSQLDATDLTTLADDPTYPDPETLLDGRGYRFYTINTLAGPNPGPRSALAVEQDSATKAWRPYEYGNGPLVQSIVAALSSWEETKLLMMPPIKQGELTRNVVLIDLPALNLHLLYYRPSKLFTIVERLNSLPSPGDGSPNAELFKGLVKLLPKMPPVPKPLKKMQLKQ